MEKRRNIKIMVVLGVLFLTAAAMGESAGVLLQEGIYAEQTEGDLDKAIGIYEKVLTDFAESQRVAAKATYQLGMCYLKKGQEDKAVDYFQQVVSKYSSEKVLAEKAREQLEKIAPKQEFTSMALVPVVIGTSPETYANNVEPEIGKISVTFDRTMADGSWSWVKWNYPYPETTGQPYYDVTKTKCTLPVKLEAGKVYFIRINAEPYTSFMSAEGVSAQPYVLVFATKDEKGNATPIPEDMLAKAKELNAIKPLRPYTQQMYNEIDPNGVIHFINPNNHTNNTAEPITTTSFINSDFVNVTGMYYQDGKPVKYTTTHEGNHFRYNITFDKPILPGETIEGTVEGTITGLIKPVAEMSDTYQYYMNHSPNANVPTLRIETYLLPKGAEVISTSPGMKKTEKEGRIELAVEKIIPAGGSLLTTFQYTLSGAKLASAEPLEFEPAPWVDGEVMEVRLKHPSGREYGTIIYSAQSNTLDDNNTWQIISHMYVSESSISQYTFVEAEAESFAPIYGQTTNWTGDFVAEYNEENVKLTVDTEGKESTRDVPVQGIAYDNEQAIYLIRRMPLAEGYEGSFPIFTVQSGTVIECRIKVLGVEEVTVEAGTFNCYKTDLSIYTESTRTLQHTLWFSVDEHKYLVKYDVGGTATMELAKIWQKDKDRPLTFENEEPHFTVAMPPEWRFYSYVSAGPQFILQLIPPEVKAWSLLVWQKRGTDPNSASAMSIAKVDCEKLKGFFENYITDETSWKEYKINGLGAAQYFATYQEKGSSLQKRTNPKEMVEYRTYIVDQSNIYWFVFRIEKDKFEQSKTEFDSIINSFKANAD